MCLQLENKRKPEWATNESKWDVFSIHFLSAKHVMSNGHKALALNVKTCPISTGYAPFQMLRRLLLRAAAVILPAVLTFRFWGFPYTMDSNLLQRAHEWERELKQQFEHEIKGLVIFAANSRRHWSQTSSPTLLHFLFYTVTIWLIKDASSSSETDWLEWLDG